MLIVDDEAGPRESLKMVFNDDYAVTLANSGEEAISYAQQRSFHVVITDIRMRGLSGIDVLRKIKEIDPHTEVIVLTAYETLDTARQAISLGASDYLRKPFDIDHIQKVVKRCFDNHFFVLNHEIVLRKDVNAAKTNFLEIVSHELNTPMNGIVGFIELLEETNLDDEQRDYLETIRDCSLKYFEHVQDILTYAKISMSDSEISKSTFNPVTLLLKQLKEIQVSPQVELISDISDQIPEMLTGPEQEIRIVLRKLLQNAAKFTDRGTISVSMSCQPVAKGRYRLVAVVSDTGTGIAPALIENDKIFDPFTQGDSSLKRAHQGMGLGLSLCRKLADQIGGEISVESTFGEGSSFEFCFELLEDYH